MNVFKDKLVEIENCLKKKIKKKKIKKNVHSFLPLDDIEGYTKTLDEYINMRCKSIGLLGGFATGKTSIINKYKRDSKSDIIVLSTASFKFKGDDDNDQSFEDVFQVEKIIIHQLHLLLGKRNTLNRELSITEEVNIKCAKFQLIIAVLSSLLVLSNTFPQVIQLNLIFDVLPSSVLDSDVLQWLELLIYMIAVTLLVYDIYSLIKNKKIKEVKTSALSVSISETNETKNEYIMSATQMIVELILEYYKELNSSIIRKRKPKKLIIVVEDIDRSNDKQILQLLYHINSILKVKDLDIFLIYSIDQLSAPEDATKFFDAIIDVLPFYDKTNAGVKLGELISELANSDKYSLNPKFKNSITQYFNDIRHLKRAINLFKQYRDKEGEESKFSNEKIFAVSTVMILYPELIIVQSTTKNDDFSRLVKLVNKYGIDPFDPYSKKDEEYDDISMEKEVEKLKSDIIGYDKLKENLLNYLFQEQLIDMDYKYIVSNDNSNYSETDKHFIDNFHRDQKIPILEGIRLEKVETFIEDYVSRKAYEKNNSLISEDIIDYLLNKYSNSEDEFWNLQSVIINLNKNLTKELIEKFDFRKFFGVKKIDINNLPEGVNPNDLDYGEETILQEVKIEQILTSIKDIDANSLFELNTDFIKYLIKVIRYGYENKTVYENKVLLDICGVLEEKYLTEFEEQDISHVFAKTNYEVKKLSCVPEQSDIELNYELNNANIKYIYEELEKSELLEKKIEVLFSKLLSQQSVPIDYESMPANCLKDYIRYTVNNGEIKTISSNENLMKNSNAIFSYGDICEMDSDKLKSIVDNSLYDETCILFLHKNGFDKQILPNIRLLDIIEENADFEVLKKEDKKKLCRIYINDYIDVESELDELIDFMKKHEILFMKTESLKFAEDGKIRCLELLTPSQKVLEDFLTKYNDYFVKYFILKEEEIFNLIDSNIQMKNIEDSIYESLFLNNIPLEESNKIMERMKTKLNGNQYSVNAGYNELLIKAFMDNSIKMTRKSLDEWIKNKSEISSVLEEIVDYFIDYSYNRGKVAEENCIVRDGLVGFTKEVTSYILKNTSKIEGYEFNNFVRDLEKNYEIIRGNIANIIENSNYKKEFSKFFELKSGNGTKRTINNTLIFSDQIKQNKIFKDIADQMSLKFNTKTYVLTRKKNKK